MMPTLDVSKMKLVTDREKAKAQAFMKGLFDKALAGLVPPSSQQEYELMKSDPLAYLQNRVKEPPTTEGQAGIIQSVAGAMPIAFHGTPHTWEANKPDITKVGTGQGAQSYGHGLYFAENPKTAAWYKENLSGVSTKRTFQGRDLEVGSPEWVAGDRAKRGLERARAESNRLIETAIPGDNIDFEKQVLSALNKAKSRNDWTRGNYGTMYQVNIPDEHVAKMLDWDKPLSEQPKISDVLKKGGAEYNTGYGFFDPSETGEDVWREMRIQLGDKGASEFLNKIGIPGIKYLDQGSRQAGQGTRNFVVFDESIIKDVKKK